MIRGWGLGPSAVGWSKMVPTARDFFHLPNLSIFFSTLPTSRPALYLQFFAPTTQSSAAQSYTLSSPRILPKLFLT